MSTMDFFEHQDAARRRTAWLVVFFGLAVAAIVLAVYAVVAALVSRPWDPLLFAAVSAATVTVIAAGSLYRLAQLRAGGETVALELGGRRVDPRTADLAERRLLNVVEEMALASGTPVPPVYVLDHEAGINAFAAGHEPASAVIGVSRGSLVYLTRDELQGVVAHEFSHILNGDMRLNLRLVGVLHGILLLAVIGYYLLRVGGAPRRSSKKGGEAATIALLGLALLIIGYVGVFFAKLIRCAVSRQREYLADAAAVQFTRYPAGIAGALKKIGGLEEQSRIRDPHAEEMSHLFFADAFAGAWLNWLATHPPLAERIQRLDPTFDGRFPRTTPLVEEVATVPQAAVPQPPPAPPVHPRRRALVPAALAAQSGTVTPEHLAHAAAVMQQMPPALLEAMAEPHGARAVIYALLLDAQPAIRQRQLQSLQAAGDEFAYRQTCQVLSTVDALSEEARLPLADRTIPALKQLSPSQYAEFRRCFRALAQADGRLNLFEYTLQAMALRVLDIHFGLAKPGRPQYYGLRGLREPLATVLSTLARAGHQTADQAQQAFEVGAAQTGQKMALRPEEQCTLREFDTALAELRLAAPKVKRQILAACAACVAADGTVAPREGELLRAIAATLDCPVPPLVCGDAAGHLTQTLPSITRKPRSAS